MIKILGPMLALSGVASLTYQVTWVRLLGLSMGATSAAVSTVVAAFFLGLGLGSYWVARSERLLADSLKSYVLIEALIGVSGLALLPLLLNLDRVLALAPWLGTSLISKFAACMALLLLPTLGMGATFPLMAHTLAAQRQQIGTSLSDLYGFNTLGAVLGAVLSGFVFIPQLGLDGASFVACGFNLVVVLLGSVVRWRLGAPAPPSVQVPNTGPDRVPPALGLRQYKALGVLVITGFVSIAVEVAWTKYLVMFVGTTIYGFSAILAAFLLGMALGSWSLRRYVDSWPNPEKQLVVGLCLLGLCLLLTRSGLSAVPVANARLLEATASSTGVHLARYAVVFVLVLPATWLFGALFPLTLRIYCGESRQLGKSVGRAYAVNTVAGIAGSVVAGFLWLPTYGTSHLLTWTAVFVLLSPFVFWSELSQRWALAVPAALTLGVGLLWWLPAPDYERLLEATRLDLGMSKQDQRTVFLREGKTGLVSVATSNGRDYKIYNNGLNESRIDSRDPYNALLMESLLGIYPYLLQEKPRSAFVVGLGGGATMRALEFTGIESLRVVELEPLMQDAVLRVLDREAAGLADPRLTLSFDDARSTLLMEERSYDIIVSQPSHPWRAGAANLFTREFFEIVKSRLSQGGIYGQWLALFRMDADTFRSIVHAFVDAFPEAFTVANPQHGDVLFFGSSVPLKFIPERVYPRAQEDAIQRLFERLTIRDPVQLLQLFALSRSEMLELSVAAPMSTDTNLLPEVRLAGLLKNPKGERAVLPALRRFARFDVLPYIDDSVQSQWLQQLILGLNGHGERHLAQQGLRQLRKVDPEAEQRLSRLLRRD